MTTDASEPHSPPSPVPPPPQKTSLVQKPTPHGKKRIVRLLVILGAITILAGISAPYIHLALTTVSTDDAYVNGHVTFVAPRVSGLVTRVLVDDNNRVHKGDLLVQLDKEPNQTQVNISQSTVTAAEADLAAARAQAQASVGQIRAARFSLDHAIEDVHNQIALLSARVATLESRKAALDKSDRAIMIAGSAYEDRQCDHRRI